ncbi:MULTISPECIES: LexA family protein [unclassified Sphingomonas]|jgi:hypothetical protein|uniref:LexA family protein n=1 Tax=unclassified Sphingomonas TaxID=196159 RepID=UPI000836067C|nr:MULTISPECIES: hypothetical protein [unclassified Sphingomonas]
MSPRQAAVLTFVRDHIGRFGEAPTLREIGEAIGVSTPGAKGLVDALVADGRLLKTRARHRAIELPDTIDLRGVTSEAMEAELARRGFTLAALDDGRGVGLGPRTRTCAASSCHREVSRGQLFCRAHWFDLPAHLREGIHRAHSRRDRAAYQQLVGEARDLVDASKYSHPFDERGR